MTLNFSIFFGKLLFMNLERIKRIKNLANVYFFQVFLHRGELCIISLPKTHKVETLLPVTNPTIPQALKWLSSHSREFVATKSIRAAVYKRISG